MAAATTPFIGAPAFAQTTTPAVRWRMQSSFPKSLDTLFGAAQMFCERVERLTGGRFQIRPFAAGEIVGGLQVLDAVQNGTIEVGHTASYYYIGRNRALAFDTALPFGLNARQQNAWMYYGNGLELMRDLFRDFNIVSFPAGNTGTQMGGWFRREIRSLKDMEGLRFRIPGLAGEMLSRIGVLPQVIAPADIYPALERGTIDATEFVGPYDDEKLGLAKVTRFYYYPGFWEGGAQLSIYVGLKEWEKLPREFQQAIDVASAEININMLAEYDAKNPAALARIQRTGVQVRPFPVDVMQAAQKAAFAIYDEESAKNPAFAKIYANWRAFRDAQHSWHRTAELAYDSFVLNNAPGAVTAPTPAPSKK
ncbi:MAG: TRAP transporter substrate-binding protein [Proteobacteria bacterium]|nr:TRAP transporter substrate-binding protein [Burkholderiales bacterium]